MKTCIIAVDILNNIINYLDNSNLPHKDVKELIKDLASAKLVEDKVNVKEEES